MGKRIYIICPVTGVREDEDTKKHVANLEKQGHTVFYPPRDAPQECPTGEKIVKAEWDFLVNCDQVDVFWDTNSKGSHFDLGMAFAFGLPIHFVKLYHPDKDGKTYLKAISILRRT